MLFIQAACRTYLQSRPLMSSVQYHAQVMADVAALVPGFVVPGEYRLRWALADVAGFRAPGPGYYYLQDRFRAQAAELAAAGATPQV